MAKLTDDQEVIRSSFRSLKKLYDELKPDMNDFEFLSMGMSNDYEIAIEEGACFGLINLLIIIIQDEHSIT